MIIQDLAKYRQKTPYYLDNPDTAVRLGNVVYYADKHASMVDFAILDDFVKRPAQFRPTFNFVYAQIGDFQLKKSQDLYSKIIKRCFKDIDEAILNKSPQEQIDKLFQTLELFTAKYGHFYKK